MSEQLTITITARDGASQTFRAVGQSAQQMGQAIDQASTASGGFDNILKQIDGLEQQFNRAGQALTVFGAAITGAAAVGVKQFAGLESAMANVNSIAGQASTELAATTQQVRDLAVEMGISPTGLAEALYDIVSSGFDAAEGMQVLEASAIAARAGMTDTATAATAITAVLNAYGLEAEDAASVSDVLFKTVDSGVISFEELAGSMGRVLPLADTLNIAIEDLGAAYSELTLQGVSASEAETGLTAILTAAINPTTALAEAVEEYGYASAEALIRTEGLAGFLQFLDEAAGGSASRMQELTGNVRANNAALILAQDGAAGYIDQLDEMNNASGRTAEVFAVQMATTEAAVARASAAIRDLGITWGAAIAPGVNQAADAVSAFASILRSVPPELQNVVSIATTAGGAIALMGGVLLLMVPRIADTISAFRALQQAMVAAGVASSALRFTAIGAALIAVTAAGALLTSSWLEQRQAAADYNATLTTLDQTLESIRRRGDEGLAQQGKSAKQFVLDMEDASDAANDFQTYLELIGEENPFPGSQEFNDLNAQWEAYRQVVGDARIETEETGKALAAINAAIQDPTVNAEAYLAWANGLLETAAATKTLTDDQEALNQIIATADEMPTEFLSAYGKALTDISTQAEVTGGSLKALATDLQTVTEEEQKAAEELQKLREEFIAGALAIGTFDDALSIINLAGMNSQASEFADAIGRSGQALDNTYRIIVGNLQGIVGSVEQVYTTLSGLFELNDEGWSQADELLNLGAISWEEYAAAQDAAYASTTASVDAQRSMNEILIQQAPYLQSVQQGTATYLAQLADMPTEIQRTTLAFMDQNSVMQAQEIVMQGSAAALGQWGDEGRQAFEGVIRGAIQTNPLLFDILSTMEVISGTPLDFDINWDTLAEGGSAIEELTTNVGALVDTLREIYGLPPIEIEANVEGVAEASETVDFLYRRIQEVDGSETFAIVRVQADGKEEIDEMISSVDNLDGTYTTIQVDAETGETYEAILAYDGTVISTTYVDVVPRIAGGGGAAGETLADLAGMLGIPETITTEVTVETTGTEEITAAKEAVDALENKTVTVTFEADTSSLDNALIGFGIGGSGGAADFTAPTVYITIDAVDNASAILAEVTTAADAIPETESVTVIALGAGEVRDALRNVTSSANDIPESETVSVNAPGAGEARESLRGVTAAANAIPESESVTVNVYGAASAVSALNNVASAAANIPSSVSTTITTNRVTAYSTIGTAPFMHGGIAGYDTGGLVTARMAEAGPERLHFANGGTAWAMQDALYTVPMGTLVSPANANPAPGGRSIVIDFSGATFNNTSRTEMRQWAEEDLAPSLMKALDDRDHAYGGWR